MESKSFVCGSVAMQSFQHLWKLAFVKPDWLGGFRCPANVTGFGIMKYVLCSHWYIDTWYLWSHANTCSSMEWLLWILTIRIHRPTCSNQSWVDPVSGWSVDISYSSLWDGERLRWRVTTSYNAGGKCEHSHRFPNLKLNDISIAERKILITIIYSLHLDTVLVCTSDRYPLNRGLVVAKCNNYF